MTHTVAIDVNDEQSINHLPWYDVAVVAIGEDMGFSVSATALLKSTLEAESLQRSINEIHTSVLEAMGIEEILKPEEE